MRHHDDNEMYISILKTINSGTVPDLSSYTGLSTWKLNKCLKLLQKNLLINDEKNTQIYEITEKGTQYLNLYYRIMGLLSCKPEKRQEIIA